MFVFKILLLEAMLQYVFEAVLMYSGRRPLFSIWCRRVIHLYFWFYSKNTLSVSVLGLILVLRSLVAFSVCVLNYVLSLSLEYVDELQFAKLRM